MSRDTQLGFDFAAVTYYDGQAFMVRNKLAIASAKELNGASICVAQGTTNELNVADYFRAAGWKYQVVTFATNEETIKAYESGRCDAITSDASVLASQRLVLANPAEHAVLPDIISKEPLGPVVRHGDNQWADIIRWTHLAMVNAEELGITRDNVDDMKKSTNPEIKRLLGTEGKIGEAIGLGNDWAYRSSSTSETTGRASKETSAAAPPCERPGDLMRSGIEAGCNTEFRSGNPYPRISGAVQATAAPVTVIGTTAQPSCRGDGRESEAPEVLQDPGREWHPARQSIEPEQSPRPQSAKPDRSG